MDLSLIFLQFPFSCGQSCMEMSSNIPFVVYVSLDTKKVLKPYFNINQFKVEQVEENPLAQKENKLIEP